MTENMMVSATVVIALFTVVLVLLQSWQLHHQRKVARVNYLVTLHDRRMEVFNAIEDMFAEFWREGQPPLDAAMKLRHATRNAEFVFPEGPLQFIEEIVKKSLEHKRATNRWEPLRARAYAGEELSPNEISQKDAALNERSTVEGWFHLQSKEGRLKHEFGPYLRLPKTI
jgi:hypothetical protein